MYAQTTALPSPASAAQWHAIDSVESGWQTAAQSSVVSEHVPPSSVTTLSVVVDPHGKMHPPRAPNETNPASAIARTIARAYAVIRSRACEIART